MDRTKHRYSWVDNSWPKKGNANLLNRLKIWKIRIPNVSRAYWFCTRHKSCHNSYWLFHRDTIQFAKDKLLIDFVQK